MWKLKSSTSTWNDAQGGKIVPGYHFDTTYTDVVGGYYRINFSSGLFNGAAVVTVWGEGRDQTRSETRSIQAVYQNLSLPGAIISGGNLNDAAGSAIQWGAIMAMGDINSYAAATYPRKLSKQVVRPWDTDLNPPNTDNLMWWSGYDVPELPIFDFVALRSSAAATNTLNCNGVTTGAANIPCSSVCINCVVRNLYQDPRYNSNYVWYWDNNVTINDPGVNGTMVVRGNMITNGGDWYGPFGPLGATVNMRVPANAWMEYQKFDTAATNQFPADNGLKNNKSTYILGSVSGVEGAATGGDLGFFGFVYVGGDLLIAGDADVYGSIWVVGVSTFGPGASNNAIFFNDQLVLPTLNVVLVRQSWKEVTSSGVVWP
jgi:hypothetical protein